jgi:hypothetical protein
MRKKVDKAAWEWNAELAALLVNTIKDARAQMPIDEEVLRREFLEKFVPPPSCPPLSAPLGQRGFLMSPFFYLGVSIFSSSLFVMCGIVGIAGGHGHRGPAQVEGDSTVELELASALREKSPNFKVRDLGRLAGILDAHLTSCPIPAAVTDISNIQQDAFELAIRQMQYDTRAYQVWQGKLKNYDSAPPFARLGSSVLQSALSSGTL